MNIDFLDHKTTEGNNGPSVRGFLLLIALTIALLSFFGLLVVRGRAAGNGSGMIIQAFRGLLRSNDITLAGEKEDRVNILLLGIGGKGHDGGDLTDTILLASIQPSTGKAALLSVPRDLVVRLPTNEWRKINTVNAFAERVTQGSGGDATRAALAELLAIPIPYYARVDFQGFVNLIDAVSGVTIVVEHRLDDPFYPVLGNEDSYPVENRYEHLVIEEGPATIDGTTALKYARSRRGIGVEGSDFARMKRQQKIIIALRDKLLSWGTFASPARLARIYDTLATHSATNMTLSDALRLLTLAKTIRHTDIRHVTLSDAADGLLTARIVNGAYILEPRDATFATIRALVADIFTIPPPAPAPPKTIRVALLNGTTTLGLARTIGTILEQQGFTVVTLGNAPMKPIVRTMILDRTNGKEYLAYDRLRLLLEAEKTNTPPDAMPLDTASADFIILLGENTKLP